MSVTTFPSGFTEISEPVLGDKILIADASDSSKSKVLDLRLALETLCMPVRVSDAYVAAVKRYTETPAEVFAGGAALAARKYVVIRNESTDTRVRFGVASANLQRDGHPLEPGAVVVMQFDPSVATAIYACSEGRIAPCHIAEDTSS